MTHAANNPFFGKFKTPFETPPFDKIKIEHYEPAFDEGIKQMEKEVQEIAIAPKFKSTPRQMNGKSQRIAAKTGNRQDWCRLLSVLYHVVYNISLKSAMLVSVGRFSSSGACPSSSGRLLRRAS